MWLPGMWVMVRTVPFRAERGRAVADVPVVELGLVRVGVVPGGGAQAEQPPVGQEAELDLAVPPACPVEAPEPRESVAQAISSIACGRCAPGAANATAYCSPRPSRSRAVAVVSRPTIRRVCGSHPSQYAASSGTRSFMRGTLGTPTDSFRLERHHLPEPHEFAVVLGLHRVQHEVQQRGPGPARAPGRRARPTTAVPAAHPLARGEFVDIADLHGQRWIAGTGDDRVLGVWPGLDECPEAYTARDWLAKLQLVAAGCGITTAAASLAPVAPAGVRVLPVRGGPSEQRRLQPARMLGPQPEAAGRVAEAPRVAAVAARS